MGEDFIEKGWTDEPFDALERRTSQRGDMSYAALGLYAYLQSLPGNWRILVKNLYRPGSQRDKVNLLLKELETLGYLKVTRLREKGRFCGVKRVLYKWPSSPQTDLPYTALPEPVYPHLKNREETENPESHPATPQKQQQQPSLFEEKVPEVILKVFSEEQARSVIAGHGVQRVTDVCAECLASGAKRPVAWAISALVGEWVLPVDEARNKQMEENNGNRYLSGEFGKFVTS